MYLSFTKYFGRFEIVCFVRWKFLEKACNWSEITSIFFLVCFTFFYMNIYGQVIRPLCQVSCIPLFYRMEKADSCFVTTNLNYFFMLTTHKSIYIRPWYCLENNHNFEFYSWKSRIQSHSHNFFLVITSGWLFKPLFYQSTIDVAKNKFHFQLSVQSTGGTETSKGILESITVKIIKNNLWKHLLYLWKKYIYF